MAIAALCAKRVVALRYDGHNRRVEVHVAGYTRAGRALMRCWQVSGGSVGGEEVGWKVFDLDKAEAMRITCERSNAPRLGYNPCDPVIVEVVARV
jgi:hypothetical protein